MIGGVGKHGKLFVVGLIINILAVFWILNCKGTNNEDKRETAYQSKRKYIHGILGDIALRMGKYKDAKSRIAGIGGVVRYFLAEKERNEISDQKGREDMWKSIATSIIWIAFEEEVSKNRRSMNEKLRMLINGCGYYRNEELTEKEKTYIREQLNSLDGKEIGSTEAFNIMYKMMKAAGKNMDFLRSFVLNEDIPLEKRRWMSLAILNEVRKPAFEFSLDLLDNCEDKMIRKYISSALNNWILRYGVDENGRIRCDKQ